MRVLKLAIGILAAALILLSACGEEDAPKDTFMNNEIGKPISFDYDPAINNSFEDVYFDMKVAFYIPQGIDELKDRPMMFTLSTMRNRSVAGSLIPVIEEHGMIAVTPLEGTTIQFVNMLEAMIESEYIDPDQVYVSGFSNGGRDIYELAWSQQDKINGAILLDPSAFFSGKPKEGSKLSVCIVCQDDREEGYLSSSRELNELGIPSKVIGVADTDHFGILSVVTIDQKIECFDFVQNKE